MADWLYCPAYINPGRNFGNLDFFFTQMLILPLLKTAYASEARCIPTCELNFLMLIYHCQRCTNRLVSQVVDGRSVTFTSNVVKTEKELIKHAV